MSKTIYNVKLADLIPFNLASDPKIASICAALDAESLLVVNSINSVIVLADIGNQPSDVTNLLAIEQGTPYYKQDLPLGTRRTLVANTGNVNFIKGTKAAVEQTVQAAFGSGTVQEWFEYEGQPGCFRVLVNDFPNSSSQMDEITRAIQATQRLSSHLDEVLIIVATTLSTAYLASSFDIAVYVNTTMKAPQ